jgi:hypothetical protein
MDARPIYDKETPVFKQGLIKTITENRKIYLIDEKQEIFSK